MSAALPVSRGVTSARTVALIASLVAAFAACAFFLKYGAANGLNKVDVLRSVFMLVSTFWLSWGAMQAFLGLTSRSRAPMIDRTKPLDCRVVVLVPVYEEDPIATFSRIAAMDISLAATGQGDRFDFAILSDTRDEIVAARERIWYLRLLSDRNGQGRIFYRRRADNKGKKAGNVEDFIQSSGAAYDLAIILDADSLVEGETMVEMARRMQADPKLGLLQTLPRVIQARSRFGRAMQFSAAFNSPIFARGLAMMQGHTGPFWGHNAIIRVRAFAQSCGLPELAGKPPFGGHILSHDYVEAALLARAGWTVRLDDDLDGSFEEGPENIIDHAKRDRRWCQGNLQHMRLVFAPGLRGWSRFVFVQGIFAYLVSIVWLGFLIASIVAPVFGPPVVYFPTQYWPMPVMPPEETALAIGLVIGIFGLLILPKLLIGADAVLRGRARLFGGWWPATASTMTELLLSSINAPIFLMYQTRSVFQVLLGRDGGWPAHDRGDGRLRLSDAFAASYWIVISGFVGLALAAVLSPALIPWFLPVTLPMVLSPFIIAWTSQPGDPSLFITPEELSPAPVILLRAEVLDRWHAGTADEQPELLTGRLQHV
ncbi:MULTISPECIES: glucans biosynthesis glucosyltransferase MdoH [unclassified Yoonia]|uniref:glucans biosynthesis glucosyltransferase MdoH n=1 Tax=unclassified Yoonia TaxID=2629118 RepID=UPI002AFE1EF6|nr:MULTISPECIES: glucans biosynthesis glucosyltransferase MdoH [unclassified Yoonia]